MAKLFKNALISLETIHLINNESIAALSPEPELENTQASISELQIEAIKNEAYQQGYLSGKEEGKALIEQQMALLTQQLETTLRAIPQAIAQNRLELSTEISDIVLLITQQFFMEKEANPHALEGQINHLLSQLNNKQNIELYLHPQEIETLQKGGIKLEAAHLNGMKIKSDDTLILGGYMIKTDHGMFDASIEKQIDRLKALLLQIRQRGQHATLD